MKKILLKEQVRKMPESKIKKLKKEIMEVKDSMLLAYSRKPLQAFLACETEDEKRTLLLTKDISIEVSVEETFKKAFIKLGDTEPPLGDFLPNKGLEKYVAYGNLLANGWQYLLYQNDDKTGYDAIAHVKDGHLLIGISGSDENRADWMDNNIRLVVPKGILTPSQFTILKTKMKEIINAYVVKADVFPKKITITGHSLGGAVATMAYGELYFQAIDNSCEIQVVTYNSAPLRIEQFEELLTRRSAERSKVTADEEVSLALESMLHIVNNGDLVNNLLYGLTKTLSGFDHIGYRIIIDSLSEHTTDDNSIRFYAEEHVDLPALIALKPVKQQNMQPYVDKMLKDGGKNIPKELQKSIHKQTRLFKGKFSKKKYATVKAKGKNNE